jgi:hypothetical protein
VGWTQNATAYAGVNGTSTQNGSPGVQANHTSGGVALEVAGKMTINNSTLVTNLNAGLLNGLKFDSIAAAGTGTGNYVGTTKPSGTTTSNQWLKIDIGGVFYYIPAWQ